jgi:uncharacterized protein
MQIVLIGLSVLVAVVGAAYVTVCLVIAHRMTRAKRTDPYRVAHWQDHSADRIAFSPRLMPGRSRDRSLRLAGWYIPVTEPVGAVVLVHGKDCCRGEELNTDTYELVQSLRTQGFSTMLIDLRGHGESDASRMTYGLRERHDVLGAIDWLVAHGYAAGKIGLFGASMGGACALAAAAHESAVGALVTDSAFADFDDMMLRKFRKLTGLPNIFLPGALLVGRVVLRENLRLNKPVRDALHMVGRPVLVIHSDSDQFVPLDHAQAIAIASAAQLWVTKGPHHMASFRQDPALYCGRVASFFSTALGGLQGPTVAATHSAS